MNARLGKLLALAALLTVSTTALADDPVDIPQELRDRAARAAEEKKYAEAMRAILNTSIGTGVKLSEGSIAREEHSVVPSVARFVAYDALKEIAVAICKEIKDTPLLVTSVNLADLNHQYLATTEQLGYLKDKAKQAKSMLDGTSPRIQSGSVMATALGLDAIGSIAKAIVGLAGFFKSDRKISFIDAVVDAPTVMLALRSCPKESRPRIFDATSVRLESIEIQPVTELKVNANNLRTSIEAKQDEQEKLKLQIAAAKQQIEAAKDDPKAKEKAKAEQASLEERSTGLAAKLTAATAVLAVVDTALDKLYAVVETTGTSPIVTLARMKATIDRLATLKSDEKAEHVLTVKVQHASGYSQVSKAWWRDDRLDFAGGIAVTYEIDSLDGEFIRANGYYLQTPWMRLQEGSGQVQTTLKQWAGEPRN